MENAYEKRSDYLLERIRMALAPKKYSISVLQTTTTGTIKAGFSKVSFLVSGAASGTLTVNGVSIDLDPGESIVIGGDNRDVSLDEMTYDATGTEFKIIQYRI